LSEVKSFLREEFLSDRQVEVLVVDHSVFVNIEVTIDSGKVLVTDVNAPKVQIELKLILADET
jgi:hypothetical protein